MSPWSPPPVRPPAAAGLLVSLAALLTLLPGCRCGPTAGSDAPTPPKVDAGPPAQGKWFAPTYRTHRFDPDLTEAQRQQIAMLEAIGYADGTQPFTGETSVTLHDRERAWQGLNFYNSGHGPEAVLMDMDGNELHRWHHDFWDAFPGYPVQRSHGGTHNWRRAWLLPDGHVLAIHEGLGMIRIDADSGLVWANPGRMHHDAEIVGDAIWVLAREARLVERVDPDRPILEDYVVELDLQTGEERRRLSLLEAVEGSAVSSLFRIRHRKADLYHTNSLRVLDDDDAEAHEAFATGHLMVSMRNVHALAVVDPDAGQVVWAARGPFRLQHDPTLTTDGHLMVFDNRGAGKGRSRVLKLTLPDLRPAWTWPDAEEVPLDSGTLGAARELPNGNVLITESEQGRALEITPEGQVVWTFHNPHVAGPDGRFVAALFEVARLPADLPIDWADGR